MPFASQPSPRPYGTAHVVLQVVNMNFAAVDKALEHLVEIPIPEGWGKDQVGTS